MNFECKLNDSLKGTVFCLENVCMVWNRLIVVMIDENVYKCIYTRLF